MPIRVVASVIEREGRLLVCERPAHKRHGGLWEFPGGKVEPGESDLDAVRRELREELDVDVVDVAPAEFSILDPGSPFLIVFLPVEIRGEPRCLEHAALAWLGEEELGEVALAPSDRRYLEWRVGLDSGFRIQPGDRDRWLVASDRGQEPTRSPNGAVLTKSSTW